MSESPQPPRVFVSYSWDSEEHREWVRSLCTRLRSDGVDVTLDQWHLKPGDQLPRFMETAVRENDFVLIICTPRYRDRSNQRWSGVGYEGDIMTAEVHTARNHRKFIPVLRSANWTEAAPGWLLGKLYVDLSDRGAPEEGYRMLLRHLHGVGDAPPPLGSPPASGSSPSTRVLHLTEQLRSKEPRERADAALALATFGEEAEVALDRLVALLEDDQGLVSVAAYEALATLGVARRLPRLLDLVLSTSAAARIHAMRLIADLGPVGAPAIPAIVEMLRGHATVTFPRRRTNEPIRGPEFGEAEVAEDALVRFGTLAVPPLIAAINGGSWNIPPAVKVLTSPPFEDKLDAWASEIAAACLGVLFGSGDWETKERAGTLVHRYSSALTENAVPRLRSVARRTPSLWSARYICACALLRLRPAHADAREVILTLAAEALDGPFESLLSRNPKNLPHHMLDTLGSLGALPPEIRAKLENVVSRYRYNDSPAAVEYARRASALLGSQ